MGAWDAALALAGFEPPPPKVNSSRSLSSLEILERCWEFHGTQPTSVEAEKFAQANGIPYSRRSEAGHWPQKVAKWKRWRTEQGLPVPDDTPPIEERPDYTKDMGAARPGERRLKPWNNIEDCLPHVIAYIEQLPPRQLSSAKGYNRWSSRHPDAPYDGELRQHGGWLAFRQLAHERIKQNYASKAGA